MPGMLFRSLMAPAKCFIVVPHKFERVVILGVGEAEGLPPDDVAHQVLHRCQVLRRGGLHESAHVANDEADVASRMHEVSQAPIMLRWSVASTNLPLPVLVSFSLASIGTTLGLQSSVPINALIAPT